jgi:hypothetical protein
MDEAEWQACMDPKPMLEALRGKASDRKFRLFAVACCRRFWNHLYAPSLRNAVEVAEQFADGLATIDEMAASFESVRGQPQLDRLGVDFKDFPNAATDEEEGWAAAQQDELTSVIALCASAVGWLSTPDEIGVSRAREAALDLVESAGHEAIAQDISARHPQLCESPEAYEEYAEIGRKPERLVQGALLRDIFGNPFRPASLSSATLRWNDCTACRIAQVIYDVRQLPAGTLDTTRLAVLADALLDAGCDDEELIRHCRSTGPHVRGCWVVDLVLAKQ